LTEAVDILLVIKSLQHLYTANIIYPGPEYKINNVYISHKD